MKHIFFPKNEKGVVLVGVVGAMLFAGLFSAIGASMVASSGGTHSNLVQATQSLAIAHAGAEWYLERLRADADWTDEANQTISFAQGSFTVQVSSAAATEVAFTVTGSIPSSLSGVTLQRNVALTALKLPRAVQFALFQGIDPGSNFQIDDNGGSRVSIVTGNVWSRGSVQVNATNSVLNGKVYVPNTESVTGGGSYTAKLISAPYLSMPVIDSTYYTNLMATYNALLDANSSTTDRTITSGTFNINTDAACSGGICNFRNFTTNGTVTITGNGTILANRDLSLHTGGSANSLTVTPSAGGSITFLASRNLEIGRGSDPTINIAAGCNFYSRAETGTGQHIQVRGANTTIRNALMMAVRQIIVEDAADIIDDSVLFVSNASSTSNNRLIITGSSGVTSIDGSVISLARGDPGIRIQNGGNSKTNVSVTGLVYAYNPVTNGYCDIDDAVIQGSLVCERFSGNRIRNVAVTYDAASLPSVPPRGFEGFVTVEANSWDAL